MFKFELDNLRVEYAYVTSITEALGGSVRVVEDVDHFTQTGEYTTKRYQIPYSVARTFKKRNKGKSNYLVPVQMALVWYDDQIVCVEKRSQHAITNDLGEWDATVSYAVRRNLPETLGQHEWHTDGVTIYRIPDTANDPAQHEPLTKDNRFYAVSVSAVKFSDLTDLKLIGMTHTRSIVAFQPKKGPIVFTPPVWTSVMDMRSSFARQNRDDDVAKKDQPKRFDLINDNFMVNLEFVLNAAKSIGGLFGFEQIAFLQLERYMIDLCTVNLPKVQKAKRSTYDTDLSFIICFAWLMGFVNRCENLDQYASLRSVFKVLCQNGLFSKEQHKKTLDLPPPIEMSKDDARVNIKANYSDEVLANYWMNGGKFQEGNNDNVQQFLTGSVD